MDFSLHSPGFTPARYGPGTPLLRPTAAFGGLSLRPDRAPPHPHAARTARPEATTVRRVRADDADAFQAFIGRLSPASRRMRFHGAIHALSPALLQYLTQTENPRHQAWLAFDGAGAAQTVVGEARFAVTDDGGSAEFALVVADDRRGQGVADRLLQTLVHAAPRAGVGMLFGDVLEDNDRMFGLLRRHGFEKALRADTDPGAVRWQRRLAVDRFALPWQ